MRTRLLLSALLALGPPAPAAAQVRAYVPVSFSGSAPTVVPSLTNGLSPSFSAATSGVSLTPGFSAPALTLTPSFTAPIPALALSVIPSAALVPAAVVPSALLAGSAPSTPGPAPKPKSLVVHSLKDLGLLFANDPTEDGGRAFDGTKQQLPFVDPAKAALPAGAFGVSAVRVHSAAEASQFIPETSNTRVFKQELFARWNKIGWLDLRTYQDASGNTFHAVDVSGRPDLVDHLPEVQPHEAALIKKIQLHVDDLQIVLREEGKTPDLIVGGIVTEMKSLSGDGLLATQLEHADAQLQAHSLRHGLGLGAVAMDLLGGKRAWADIERDINEYAVGRQIGFNRVEVYAGDERRIFVPKTGGFAALKKGESPVANVKSSARFLVPNTLGDASTPDPEVVLREITEPARRLRAAGVKATVTVYGSARILPEDVARAQLDALIKKYGKKPKRPEERKLVYAAQQAVSTAKYYEIARRFGAIVAENGGGEVAVVTGGGPGIMEAANRGALEAGGPSVGYNIHLDKEQGLNKYATPGLDFEFQHFATRKMALRHGAMALVYFPGGFGTMDELFEVLTLMQTRKMKKVPIVLIGEKSYWDKILDFSEFERMGLISPADLSLFRFADTAEGAWRAIVSPAPPVAAR